MESVAAMAGVASMTSVIRVVTNATGAVNRLGAARNLIRTRYVKMRINSDQHTSWSTPREHHMRRSTRLITAGSVAILGVTMLAGCSSSSSSDAMPTEAPASAAASTDAGMLPPVIVEEDGTTATAKVGNFIDIKVKTLAGTTIATTTPDLVELTQGGTDGSAEYNPGAKALAAGTAVITVTKADGSSYDLTVTITE